MALHSILDLVPITYGSDAGCALERSKQLAIKAESWGYHRYWVAEHHNMPGIASSATAVVIGHLASATQTIRVGSGGIMLPNHAPLMVAEQFGTLATLYPNRIDLGVGRAAGTDGLTMQALRRNLAASVEDFPRDVVELQQYLKPSPAGTARERNAGGRYRSSNLDFGLEFVWRAACRCPGDALCFCLTLCAHLP